jgi:hypothetical protein
MSSFEMIPAKMFASNLRVKPIFPPKFHFVFEITFMPFFESKRYKNKTIAAYKGGLNVTLSKYIEMAH